MNSVPSSEDPVV